MEQTDKAKEILQHKAQTKQARMLQQEEAQSAVWPVQQLVEQHNLAG